MTRGMEGNLDPTDPRNVPVPESVPAPVLTATDVSALIAQALLNQEQSWTASGRLVSAGLPSSVPVQQPYPNMSSQFCQFVTDPYKSDFNPGDKNGSILYNKATEALQETAPLNFSQEKAATLLQHFKRQSHKKNLETNSEQCTILSF